MGINKPFSVLKVGERSDGAKVVCWSSSPTFPLYSFARVYSTGSFQREMWEI